MMNENDLKGKSDVVYVNKGLRILRAKIIEVTDSHSIEGNKEAVDVKINFSNNKKPENKIVTSDNLFPDVKAANIYIAIKNSPAAH
jgi:hypothetical protein